jgi:prevent-host-death family protein
MRRFSTVDLDKKLGDVKAAAAQEPVVITEHRKDRFVIMSVDRYRRLVDSADVRRAYGAGESPPDLARLFEIEIDRILGEPRDP